MPKLNFPYGKGMLSAEVPEEIYQGKMISTLHDYKADCSQEELVRKALE